MASSYERRRIVTRTTSSVGADEVRTRMRDVAAELARVQEQAKNEVTTLDNIRRMLDGDYLSQLLRTVEEMQERIVELEDGTLSAQKHEAQAKKDLQENEQQLKKLYEAYKLQEDELDDVKRDIPLLEQKLRERETEVERLRRELASQEALGKYKEEYERAVKENHRLNDEIDQLETLLEKRTKEVAELEGDVKGLRALEKDLSKLNELEEELERKTELLAEVYQESKKLEEEREALLADLKAWDEWFAASEGAMKGVCNAIKTAPVAN